MSENLSKQMNNYPTQRQPDRIKFWQSEAGLRIELKILIRHLIQAVWADIYYSLSDNTLTVNTATKPQIQASVTINGKNHQKLSRNSSKPVSPTNESITS